jgi:hypothetical protein
MVVDSYEKAPDIHGGGIRNRIRDLQYQDIPK